MTEVRNVYKNQIVSEDIALGVGKIQQTRRGVTFEGSRINMPVPVFSFVEMSRINPNVTNRVLYEVSDVEYVVYIYKSTATEGVPSNDFPGRWVPQNIQSSIVLASNAASAVTVNGNNHNQYITITSSIGCLVTVGAAERDMGFGLIPFVPALIFIHSDTDGQVILQPAAGVTIDSPAAYSLSRKSSTIALLAIATNRWVLIGDMTVA